MRRLSLPRAVINDLSVFGSDGVMYNLPRMQWEVADEAEINAGEDNPFPAVFGIGKVNSEITLEGSTERCHPIRRYVTGRDVCTGQQFQHGLAVVLTEVRDAALSQIFIFFAGDFLLQGFQQF